ncbi:LAFA_0E07514g1_1 [Lachancea sp. 'fantastica']|nr:LAFA_0E07514g1_1 [Lachancea sp. 'fantastica']
MNHQQISYSPECRDSMSESTIQEFLAQGLLATSLSWPQFHALVAKDHELLSNDQIAYVYEHLKREEEKFLKNSRERVQEHLTKTRSRSRENLEATQLKSTVSVEDLVNSLYSAHQLLDDQTTQLNSNINDYVQKLRVIEEQMRPLKKPGHIHSILEKLETLADQAKGSQD